MPLIRPLRALHYGQDLWEIADHLVSPSVLGEPLDRSQLGDGHPLRIRNLVRGARGPLADEHEPPYTHAARLLAQWKEDGTIVRDPRPAFYVIELDDGVRRRAGVLALVRLHGVNVGRILPHEQTEGHSADDIVAQLRATGAWLSLPMGLIQDGQGALAALTEHDHRPDHVVTDGKGVRTRVWREEDPAAQLRLIEALRHEDVVIADGHHRLAAALALHAEHEAAGPSRREHPLDYMPMVLLPVDGGHADSAQVHRSCRILTPDAAALITTRLRESAAEPLADLPAAGTFLDGPPGVVVTTGAGSWGLRTPDGVTPVDEVQLRWVSPLCEVGAEFDGGLHDRLTPKDAAAAALAGDLALSIAVPGATGVEVLSRAIAGKPFPPKSTRFVPKPPKGLLLVSTRTF